MFLTIGSIFAGAPQILVCKTSILKPASKKTEDTWKTGVLRILCFVCFDCYLTLFVKY